MGSCRIVLMKTVWFWCVAVIVTLCLPYSRVMANTGLTADAVFPYHIADTPKTLPAGSVNPCYLVLANRQARPEIALLQLALPDGISAIKRDDWLLTEHDGKRILSKQVELAADYEQWFDLIYLKTNEQMAPGQYALTLVIDASSGRQEKVIPFTAVERKALPEQAQKTQKQSDWRITQLVLPVDHDGLQDERAAENVITISDSNLEDLKNSLTGRGATNWAAIEHHPVGYLLLKMDNPNLDTQMLRLRAWLCDRASSQAVPGLRPAGKLSDSEQENAAQIGDESGGASTALIALTGKATEQFVIPLYADESLRQGEYILQVSLESGDKRQEASSPLRIVMRRGNSLAVLLFSGLCVLAFAGLFAAKIQYWLCRLGPKGVITVALFASAAFGSISIPTTLFGDLLHLLLGPFSGLASGLLSGTLLYLLLTALLMLYPGIGTIALMLLLKWLLGALLFGRLTPVGLAICCTQIVLLESVVAAIHQAGQSNNRIMLALSLGLADAAGTFVSMELMMFFYRLYYADWYIWLYVLVSGFLYSAVGSLMGSRIGKKLCQVTGE